jgi:protein phosphatase
MKHLFAVSTGFGLRCAGLSDTGRLRKKNEDRFLVVDATAAQGTAAKAPWPLCLCAVADGLGGHAAGDVASRMACDGLEAFFGQLTKENFDGRPPDAVRRSLVEAFFAVDSRIGHLAVTDEAFAHMGTTLSSILFAGDRALIAHVGDSRIYRLRADRLVQLTVDHTFVQDLISYGDLTPEQAEVHPFRHMLTAAVGTQEPLEEVFTDTIATEPEDRFLLCTDGLHDMLDPESIAEILGRGMGPQETVSILINTANDCGGKDNVTAVAVFLESRSGDR